ncbi:winged helix DNA-binding domain-containing protein [Nonomuraea sp. NPDC049152]|uniref:winged helix DNA-binding domain-containing protein n=1 Tax=Nonomuraea sp. NPDC049152 TaxID=3154350 RepID=UPI0033CDAFBB
MNWNARRLERHFPQQGTPADVVAAMCGAHAQILSAAELSVSLRLPGTTRVDVREALWTERSLVKTYGPRGTVHLLPTADLAMWTGALSSLPAGRVALLTPDQIEQVVEAVGIALKGKALTIDELDEAVVAIAGPWAGDRVMDAFQTKWPRWRQATHLAAHRGVLAFGPNRGRKVTYTSPDVRPADTETAQAELLKAYLHSYGPSTPQHFARWLSAPVTWAAKLFDAAALDQVEGGWVNEGDTEAPDEPSRGVRLLPYFDAFVVGSHPREQLFPGRAWDRALAGGQAGNYPVLLIDGVVAGVWHQRRSGKKLDVTVEPLDELTTKQLAELDQQVGRVGEILEATPRLTIGKISVGPHA